MPTEASPEAATTRQADDAGPAASPRARAAEAVGSSAGRYEWLDALRAVAIADVVGHHLLNNTQAAYYGGWVPGFLSAQHPLLGMGLPVFLLCTVALSAKRTPPRPWPQTVAKKANRLLLPWLFWCVFYGVFNAFLIWKGGGDVAGYFIDFLTKTFYLGTEPLLWYLLFAFTVEVGVNAVQQLTYPVEQARPWLVTAVWLGLGVGLLTLVPHLFPVEPTYWPVWLAQRTWGFGMLVVPVGVGVGLLLREHGRGSPTRWVIAITGGLCILASIANRAVGAIDNALTLWQGRLGYGLLLMAVALALPGRAPAWLRWLGGYTFAIYLIHIFMAWVISALTYRLVGRIDPLAFASLVWAGSLLAAVVMKKTPVVKGLC